MRLEAEIEYRLNDLKNKRDVYLLYRDVCVAGGDHHGVQDASSDLREIETEMEALRWVLE